MMMTSEQRKEARTYAWAYFVVHADQRMKLFNFFLIFSGIIIGAIPTVRGMAPRTGLVVLLPLLLTLVAFIFWRLDERTRSLIKNAESALRFLDSEWLADSSEQSVPPCVRLIERDDDLTRTSKKKWWARAIPRSYTHNFRIVYVITGALGLGLALWAWMVDNRTVSGWADAESIVVILTPVHCSSVNAFVQIDD